MGSLPTLRPLPSSDRLRAVVADARSAAPTQKTLILRHTPTPRTAVATLERALRGLPREPAAKRAGHAAAGPGRAHRAIAADGAGQALVGADAASGNVHRRLRCAGAAVVADRDRGPGAVIVGAAARALGARGRFLARRAWRVEGAGDALVPLADAAAGRALRQRRRRLADGSGK